LQIKVLPLERESGFVSKDPMAFLVPWLYRAIDLRAKAVSTVPLTLYKDGQEVKELENLRTCLYVIEQSLCLYGRAYAILEGNRLRWLSPLSISPIIDEKKGIAGFRRVLNTKEIEFKPDDLAYIFLPGADTELYHSISPAEVALQAAKIAFEANEYLNAFFKRGAIGTTILSIEGNPTKEDIERLQSWWRAVVSGVKNAFSQVAFRGNVKPVVVGNSVKELDLMPLFEVIRNQICAAIGVPQTLLDDAANYATAKEHRKSFYEETIIPELKIIEEGLNRYLKNFSYLIEFNPEDLEIFQQEESSKANAVAILVDRGIITIDEAREWLGFSTTETTDYYTYAAFEELKKWQQVYKKDPERALKFKPDVLDPHLAALVRLGIKDGIEPFAIKNREKMGDNRRKKLQARLAEVLDDYREKIAKAIESKSDVYEVLEKLRKDLKPILGSELANAIYEGVVLYAVELKPIFDPAVINAVALERAYFLTEALLQKLDETNEKVVQAALQQFIQTPGMERKDLVALLEPSFGKTRAEMIATTEITRAYSESAAIFKEQLKENGVDAVRYWITNRDERVCAICGDLDGQPEDEWEYEGGPPAHPNCRCDVGIRIR